MPVPTSFWDILHGYVTNGKQFGMNGKNVMNVVLKLSIADIYTYFIIEGHYK